MQPEFISDPVFDTYRDYTAKFDALIRAAENGADIDPALITKYASQITKVLQYIIENYGFKAFQHGSTSNRIDLPQFFRNASGTEDPGDPAIIAEMAAARGQILDE